MVSPRRTLFTETSAPELPEGFSLLPNFISPAEEKKLASAFAKVQFSDIQMHGVTAKRRAAHFGLRYSYASKQISEGPAMPDFLLPFRNRFAQKLGIHPESFPQALINEYQPGAAIGWHIDGPVYEIIAGFSILGDCIFKLRPLPEEEDRAKNQKKKNISLPQPARSAYLMTGEGRWKWQHSIPAVKELRYSVTFRTVRQEK